MAAHNSHSPWTTASTLTTGQSRYFASQSFEYDSVKNA
jgi:hypothetical protein